MNLLLMCLCLSPVFVEAANFKIDSSIACISEQSSILGKHRGAKSGKPSEKAQSRFSEWLFAETFGDGKSKLRFIWTPVAENGPQNRSDYQ